ncbi:hypothetical protein L963_1873 [Leuconostoc mesenteroides subsp. cremoris T26]|nr:hypothetical protein L963_1873 [Leuconostoc mesenteroides subsp. cremoris T26]
MHHGIAQRSNLSATAEEGAHHVLRADQEGHHQDEENQRAEEAIQVAAEDQHAARDHDADDRQREGHGAGDGIAQVRQPAFIGQRAARAFRGKGMLWRQQEKHHQQRRADVEHRRAVDGEGTEKRRLHWKYS